MNRFCDPAYDAKVKVLTTTVDVAERQKIAKELNDMVTKDSMTVIPLVHRGTLSAHSNTLGGVKINAWDSEMWNVADWFRVK
jgi:peptide/nickel transport system substrate-binding protein